MRFDGRALAAAILDDLTPTVRELKKQGVTPTLAAVLVGDNASSLSFIKQKRIAAEKIGGVVTLYQLPADATDTDVQTLIRTLNTDPSIHGIIIQRPLPAGSPVKRDTLLSVTAEKDIDGFVPGSPYAVPVALGVLKILEQLHTKHTDILVMGRGETAGAPIAALLTQQGYSVTVVHSQTPNPETLLQQANTIVSCVGKRRTITTSMIKAGTILIGVGVTKDTDDKIHGDYEEEEIASIASVYTPTPGGVGPVNVACLMQNLIHAAQITP